MKNAVLVSFALLITVSLSTSCGDKSSAEKTPSAAETKKVVSQATAPTLDLVIAGPFVFFQGVSCSAQGSKCLAVWIPDVKGHTVVVGIDKGDELKQIDSGDYDFMSGIRPSNTTSIVRPVKDASIYSASTKLQNVAATPKKQPFATVLLPTPREIVSWNADPMTISSNGSLVTPNATPNLATLTVLRYDYQDGDILEVKSRSTSFWKPEPEPIGTERLMVIGFLPRNPQPNEDEHAHAREAFKATTAMLGVKWNVTFDPPPPGFQRNRPLEPSASVPQDLQDLLNLLGKTREATAKTSEAPVSTSALEAFGRINDCKAPAMLINQ